MIQMIHGDCLEKMKDIPDKSIDLILTDPPYGYGHYEKRQYELARCPHGCAELSPDRWNTRSNGVANNVIKP
jgi:DNA modification methylase